MYVTKICDAAAEGLQIQHRHEYGFFGEQFNERATIVSEMSDSHTSHIVDCKRDLAISGVHIENTSNIRYSYRKCSYCRFKA